MSTSTISFDNYCWFCDHHISNIDFHCKECGRGYHVTECSVNNSKSRRTPPYLHVAGQGYCYVCQQIMSSHANLDAYELPSLNKAIVKLVDKILTFPESAEFALPVDESKFSSYRYFVANKMDLGTIKKTAMQEEYRSSDEFLIHLQMIRHNAKVYNLAKENLFQNATILYNLAYPEYCKLSYCIDCYLLKPADQFAKFTRPCCNPHGLTWAPWRNDNSHHPLFLPAKITNFIPGETRDKREDKVEVAFFGLHQTISDISMGLCFAFSKEKPTRLQAMLKELPKGYERIDDELKEHLEYLELRKSGLNERSKKLPSRFPTELNIYAENNTVLRHKHLYMVKGVFRSHIPDIGEDDEGGPMSLALSTNVAAASGNSTRSYASPRVLRQVPVPIYKEPKLTDVHKRAPAAAPTATVTTEPTTTLVASVSPSAPQSTPPSSLKSSNSRAPPTATTQAPAVGSSPSATPPTSKALAKTDTKSKGKTPKAAKSTKNIVPISSSRTRLVATAVHASNSPASSLGDSASERVKPSSNARPPRPTLRSANVKSVHFNLDVDDSTASETTTETTTEPSRTSNRSKQVKIDENVKSEHTSSKVSTSIKVRRDLKRRKASIQAAHSIQQTGTVVKRVAKKGSKDKKKLKKQPIIYNGTSIKDILKMANKVIKARGTKDDPVMVLPKKTKRFELRVRKPENPPPEEYVKREVKTWNGVPVRIKQEYHFGEPNTILRPEGEVILGDDTTCVKIVRYSDRPDLLYRCPNVSENQRMGFNVLMNDEITEMMEVAEETNKMESEVKKMFDREPQVIKQIKEIEKKIQTADSLLLNPGKVEQWKKLKFCALCNKRAKVYCCLNSNYCSEKCQFEDLSVRRHDEVCHNVVGRNKKQKASEAAGSAEQSATATSNSDAAPVDQEATSSVAAVAESINIADGVAASPSSSTRKSRSSDAATKHLPPKRRYMRRI